MTVLPAGLPEEHSDEPLRTVKLAEVRGRHEPRLHPIGRFAGRSYDHLAPTQATCHRQRHHAPAVNCTCGFHSVATVSDLPRATPVLADSVVLDVELTGLVVEHERGYRAEQQSVLGVRFPANCSWCGAHAEFVIAGRRWRSACRSCARRRQTRSLARADATAVIGVDVTFADLPAEPSSRVLLGRLRSVAMTALTTAAVTLGTSVSLPMTTSAVIGACLGVSMAATWFTWTARSIRRHEALFVCQCTTLFCASLLIAVR